MAAHGPVGAVDSSVDVRATNRLRVAVTHGWLRALLTWGLVAVMAAMAYVASAGAAGGRSLPATALVAGVAAWAVLSRPRAGVVLLLVLGATVFPQRLMQLELGGIRTDPTELLFLLLVAHALLQRAAWRTPLRGPLLLLMSAFLVGAATAVYRDAPVPEILAELKTAPLYLLPLVLAVHYPDAESRRRLEDLVIRLAVAGSALVLITAAVGLPYFAGGAQEIRTLELTTSTARLRPAVLALAVVATLLIVARMATARAAAAQVLQLGVLSTLVIFSYTRSTLVPLVIGVVLVAALHTGRRLPRRLLRNGLVAVVVVVVLGASASVGLLGTPGATALKRIQSVSNPELLSDHTYVDRRKENAAAVEALKRSPIVGVGLGQPYGAVRVVYLENPPRLIKVPRTFIHNSFYGIWLQCGLLGLLALSWLGLATLRAAQRARRSLPPSQSAICIAGAAGVMAFAFAAVFQTVIYHRPSIIGLGLALFFAAPQALRESRQAV